MQDMPIRKMDFEFPSDMDFVFIDNDPVQSYTFIGAWMMLPYLEPYLINIMRAALPKIKDEALREDLKRF